MSGEVFTTIEEFGSPAWLRMGDFKALGERQSSDSGSGPTYSATFWRVGRQSFTMPRFVTQRIQ